MSRALLAALLVGGLLAAAPARASFDSFIAATCGPSCPDPIGEQALARDNWSALQAMGTTGWMGASIAGTTVDAASLLGASRIAGASELDRWLNTGEAASTEVAQAMSDALRANAGLDVTLITGILTSNQSADPYANTAYQNPSAYGSGSSYGSSSSSGSSIATGLATSLAGGILSGGDLSSTVSGLASSLGGQALGGALGGAIPSLSQALGGSSGSGYCSQSIDEAQNANAMKYVNAMQQIATSKDYGFSQNGGQPISSGAKSGSGYYSGGCLEQLMTGTRDLLFKPPQLSSLLSQLGGMFGGGGGGGGAAGGCGAQQSIMSQIAKSMPNAIFKSGNGGFLPAVAFGGSGLASGSGLSGLGSSTMSNPRSLSALLGR